MRRADETISVGRGGFGDAREGWDRACWRGARKKRPGARPCTPRAGRTSNGGTLRDVHNDAVRNRKHLALESAKTTRPLNGHSLISLWPLTDQPVVAYCEPRTYVALAERTGLLCVAKSGVFSFQSLERVFGVSAGRRNGCVFPSGLVLSRTFRSLEPHYRTMPRLWLFRDF